MKGGTLWGHLKIFWQFFFFVQFVQLRLRSYHRREESSKCIWDLGLSKTITGMRKLQRVPL